MSFSTSALSRFAINFNCDCDGETVGVHFNPRQDEEDVVLNSKVGDWQEEERGVGWFPFNRGQFFDVLFIAWDGKFMVRRTGKHTFFLSSIIYLVVSDLNARLQVLDRLLIE